MRFFLTLLCLSGALACSTKSTDRAPVASAPSAPVSATGEPAPVEGIKAPAKVNSVSQNSRSGAGVYFAEIQILSETLASSDCDGTEQITSGQLQDFRYRLNENSQIETIGGAPRPSIQAYNVRFQSIGYDQARFRGSIQGDNPVDFLPYALSFRLRPGSIVQIKYFDQVHNIDLATVPILSFQAKEQRSTECQITHNVNLFSEKAGSFPLSPQP